MQHAFDRDEWERRKAAREQIQADHAAPTSVPALRRRVYELELAAGLVPEKHGS